MKGPPAHRIDAKAVTAEMLTLQAVADDKRAVLQAASVPVGGAATDPVLRCWQRSRELGADADGRHALESAIATGAALREAQERTDELWRVAGAMVEDFAGACARRDFAALLTDGEGVVTHALGGGAFAAEAQRLRLIEGAAWSEPLRGTNAIGTALAEVRPVAVHGTAHYARVNEGLVCFAAPIRDPFGKVVAVIDATSFAAGSHAFDPAMVMTIARAVEEVLRVRTYAAHGASGLDLVERLLDRARGAAWLVERPGRVVRANDGGRALLALGGELPGWSALEAAAGRREPLAWRRGGGLPPVELTVEALTATSGEVLGLLAFAEGAAQRRRCVEAAPLVTAAAKPEAAFARILGDDAALEEARRRCARLAQSRLPVLLLSESGSGKELFARAVHDASPWCDGPWVAVNCGAIQPDLLLSELFGYGEGAFTGAVKGGRGGRIAAADGGTLFLDEVAELSPDAQVALLRVLEDGSYRRVGEDRERRASIRIVAATCRDLEQMVAEGAFRQDLFFRIGGARVSIPPLRQRSDLGDLVDALWARQRAAHGGGGLPPISAAARAILMAHPWPGNVRELESALGYAAVMGVDEAVILPQHLPPMKFEAGRADTLGTPPPGADAPKAERTPSMDASRRDAVAAALAGCEGNISAAARELGVARSTVYRLARRFGLPLPARRGRAAADEP